MAEQAYRLRLPDSSLFHVVTWESLKAAKVGARYTLKVPDQEKVLVVIGQHRYSTMCFVCTTIGLEVEYDLMSFDHETQMVSVGPYKGDL